MNIILTMENNKHEKAEVSKLNNDILKRIQPRNYEHLNNKICVSFMHCAVLNYVRTITNVKVTTKIVAKTNSMVL
jgi:hypothetical protein